MKSLNFFLTQFSILLLLFLSQNFSCTAQIFNPKTDNISKVEKGEMIFLISESTLKQSVLKANNEFASVDLVKMDGTIGEDDWYFIAIGKATDGNYISLAVKVKTTNGGTIYQALSDSHTCKGYCCGSCKFMRETGSNKIVGCDCGLESDTSDCTNSSGTLNGRCDHTISSALSLATVPRN